MKIIRKFIPVSLYDMPGMEQWLEEMANQGLFPLNITTRSCSFRSGGQPGTRFRLEPHGKTLQPTQEQLDLYQEAGWEYIFSVGGMYFVFYTTDSDAPELHTDLVTKGQSLDRLARKIRGLKYFLVLYPCILLPLLIALPSLIPASRFDVQPESGAHLPFLLIKLGTPTFVLLVVMVFLLFCWEFQQLRRLLALHRNLKEGLPPPPSPGPRKRLVFYHLLSIAIVIPLLVNSLGRLIPRDVPLETFSRPYVALAELESTPVVPYEALFPGSYRNENTAKREFSLLAPVWYTVDQKRYHLNEEVPSGLVFSPDPGEELFHYSPSLDMTYLELLIPAMARPVAESVLDETRLINLYWTYEEGAHPDADFVILAHAADRAWQMAAIGKDNKVAVFRYAGQEELAEHLDLLTDMVQ